MENLKDKIYKQNSSKNAFKYGVDFGGVMAIAHAIKWHPGCDYCEMFAFFGLSKQAVVENKDGLFEEQDIEIIREYYSL